MIGQIEDGILIRNRPIGELQGILIPDSKGHGDRKAARIAHIPIRGDQGKAHARLPVIAKDLRIPYILIEARFAAVQVAPAALVAADVVCCAAERKPAAGDAVAVAADGGTLITSAAPIIFQAVITEHDIPAVEAKTLQRGTVSQNTGGQAVSPFQGDAFDRTSVRQGAKRRAGDRHRFFHPFLTRFWTFPYPLAYLCPRFLSRYKRPGRQAARLKIFLRNTLDKIRLGAYNENKSNSKTVE